jgi:uncharacterized iron-regulated protein
MKMRAHHPLLAAALAVLTGAASADPIITDLPLGDPARRERQVAVVLDAVTDTATGEKITPAELARRLAGVRVAFAGEEHTDLDAHRVQLRVIEELHRAGRRVLVGLEMFPATRQEWLDRWSKGLLTEEGFLRLADWYESWGYQWDYYRDIFLFARDNGLAMHAVNAPREVVSTLRTKGRQALTAEQQAMVPEKIDTTNEQFRRLFRASFEPDDPLHAKIDDAQLEGMLSSQATWDAVMGWNAAKAVEATGDPDAIIVVLVGTGHVSYGLGAERQLREGGYRGGIASVIPVPVRDADGKPHTQVRASYANFVWGIPPQEAEEFPSLGVSLAGRLGKQPTKIIQVSEGSPASLAGLEVGDVLLAIDGEKIGSLATLRAQTARYRWGDTASVRLERGGKEQKIEVAFRRVTTGD